MDNNKIIAKKETPVLRCGDNSKKTEEVAIRLNTTSLSWAPQQLAALILVSPSTVIRQIHHIK